MIRRVARKPWRVLDPDIVKAACQTLLGDKEPERIKQLLARRKHSLLSTCWDVLRKCGNTVRRYLNINTLNTHILFVEKTLLKSSK